MSFAINKNFSRSHRHIDSEKNHSTSSFLDSFENRIVSNITQRTPIIIQTLTNLCQILDDYPLTEIKIAEIQQGTIDCILWNTDHSYPIAINQNKQLIQFRQSIRKFIHEFLEFAQEIYTINDKNNDINLMIQKTMKYLILLNDYRKKRQRAYDYTLLELIHVDKQQFHQLRFISVYLRQFFLKLISFMNSK
ncbi:unnamed protein product [Adineta steineri]|uniref:Uncharacterized protein n=1 Tax=Adineta steineri TaxID=433720 RepID=A0A814KEM8_9BILA|nr:unnamed protein product [Adineta steineri]